MAADTRMSSVDHREEGGDVGSSLSSSSPPPPPSGSSNINSSQRHRPTGHNNNIHMRHRGQNSSSSAPSSSSTRQTTSSSSSANTGLHFTNIKRINVINNFGMDTRDKRNQNNNNNNAGWNWNILRIILVAVIMGWLGVLALVMKQSPPSSTTSSTTASSGSSSASSQSNAAITADVALQQWKILTANSSSTTTTMGLRRMASAVAPAGNLQRQQLHNDNNFTSPRTSADSSIDSTTNDVVADIQAKFHIPKEPPASIYELSLFGNKSPYDFQRYTPHAPSCSDPLSPESVSFTLVSQLSNDRLWMVPYHCQRWGNNYPMSIAVFTDRTVEHVKSELVANGCSEELLTVQTVKRTKYDPKGTEYPVNLMRNLAFSKVKTSHIVYADVDFWPATDLHSILSTPSVKERLASDYKLATVIPVFQMNRRCRQYWDCRDNNIPKMPKNKDEMIETIMIRKGSSFDPTNKGGHGSTMYKKWLTQETGTFADLPCINSNRYEPYLTVRYCSELPPFQEGFTGYGKNKMTVSVP